MHHSALGYSGTDGNAVWVHDNDFYDNTDGLLDRRLHGARATPASRRTPTWSRTTTSTTTTSTPTCRPALPARSPDRRPAPPIPADCSDVVPTVPVPVGTGLWIAGGNANVIRNNRFYDNWRRGTMLFPVPDAFVCGDPNNQVAGCDPTATVPATSYRNQFYGNKMGQAPDGSVQPNGVDFWWDQGGVSSTRRSTAGTAGTTTPARTAPRPASPACLRRAGSPPTTSRPTAPTARRSVPARSGRRGS